jgi:DNA-binding NarL/FixJ family response regulator
MGFLAPPAFRYERSMPELGPTPESGTTGVVRLWPHGSRRGVPGMEHPESSHHWDTHSDAHQRGVNPLRVLVADSQVPARTGIRRAIEPHGLIVVAEASNADEALRMSLAQRPDVCVLAAEMSGNGIDAARRIKESLPATKIVIMTTSARAEDLFEALRAGADGYLLMSTPASRLPHALVGVTRGEAALPRAMTGRLIAEFRARGARRRVLLPSPHAAVELTAREFEVLERLRRREGTAEIAVHLGISQVTVRRHVASLLRKLGVPDRRQAIEMVNQASLTEQSDTTTQ